MSRSISWVFLMALNSAPNTLICFQTTYAPLRWMEPYSTLNPKPQIFSQKLPPTTMFYRTSLTGRAPTSLRFCKVKTSSPFGVNCWPTQARHRSQQLCVTTRIAIVPSTMRTFDSTHTSTRPSSKTLVSAIRGILWPPHSTTLRTATPQLCSPGSPT